MAVWITFRGVIGGAGRALAAALLGLYACAAMAVVNPRPAETSELIPVVASFSVLGDMVSEIGGDYIKLTTIVGLGGDAHSFEPTPEHARALAEARVLVVNGLGFEEWLPRLLEASNFNGLKIVASDGIEPRLLENGNADAHAHHKGMVDPHAWQSLANGIVYVRNIASGLAKADPKHAAIFEERAERYIGEMKKLDAEVRQALKSIPAEKRKVVVPHDSLGYFGRDYDITFIPIMGISGQAEASAKEVAAVVDQVRETGSAAVFVESAANPKLAEQVARETGATVGGTLYVDTLSESDQPAGNYLGMIKWNAGQLIYVLKGDK